MAWRSPTTDSSPELEIKVQPRRSDPHPLGASGPSRSHNHHRPPRPPPQAYRPFKKWFPWLVPIIVVANVVLFVLAMYLNDCPQHSGSCLGADFMGRFAFQNIHENPLLGPSSATLLRMGALDVMKVVDEQESWRLVTCMWLHAGVFHVVANMVSLLFVGIRLEQEFGFVKIGLLYIISGVGGSILSALFVRTTISVGASGALFGLLGGMLSELLTNWSIYANKCAALMTLILIIVLNLAVGILPHVDNFAHSGGFISGFFLGFILLIRPQFGWVSQRNAPPGYYRSSVKSKYKAYQCVLLVISVILLITGMSIGLILLLHGVDGNQNCQWCRYLRCVPTPLWACDVHCRSNLRGNELNLTCLDDGKSQFYMLSNSNSTAQIERLCSELCS